MKLKDILAEVEAYFLPKRGTSAIIDGINDPCGNAIVIDPHTRGGLLKSSDGKLYAPVGTSGYMRTKTVIYVMAPLLETTTDDTAVTCNVGDASALSTYAYQYFVMAYQNSGGPLTFNIWKEAAKTNLLYTQSIPDSTNTLLTCMNVPWGGVYIAWSGVAGAAQRVSRSVAVLKATPGV